MNKRTAIAALLIVSTAVAPYSPSAFAAPVGTEAAIGKDREQILAAANREELRARLEVMGVRPADVSARVAALSDAEAAELAARIDAAPAGAGGGGLGAVVAGIVYAGVGLAYLAVYTVVGAVSVTAALVRAISATRR